MHIFICICNVGMQGYARRWCVHACLKFTVHVFMCLLHDHNAVVCVQHTQVMCVQPVMINVSEHSYQPQAAA